MKTLYDEFCQNPQNFRSLETLSAQLGYGNLSQALKVLNAVCVKDVDFISEGRKENPKYYLTAEGARKFTNRTLGID
jgi:hypothetical protein